MTQFDEIFVQGGMSECGKRLLKTKVENSILQLLMSLGKGHQSLFTSVLYVSAVSVECPHRGIKMSPVPPDTAYLPCNPNGGLGQDGCRNMRDKTAVKSGTPRYQIDSKYLKILKIVEQLLHVYWDQPRVS